MSNIECISHLIECSDHLMYNKKLKRKGAFAKKKNTVNLGNKGDLNGTYIYHAQILFRWLRMQSSVTINKVDVHTNKSRNKKLARSST